MHRTTVGLKPPFERAYYDRPERSGTYQQSPQAGVNPLVTDDMENVRSLAHQQKSIKQDAHGCRSQLTMVHLVLLWNPAGQQAAG